MNCAPKCAAPAPFAILWKGPTPKRTYETNRHDANANAKFFEAPVSDVAIRRIMGARTKQRFAATVQPVPYHQCTALAVRFLRKRRTAVPRPQR